MVGEPVDGVLGYTPETATEIVRNIVLYADSGGKPPPATQPTTQPGVNPAPSPPPAHPPRALWPAEGAQGK